MDKEQQEREYADYRAWLARERRKQLALIWVATAIGAIGWALAIYVLVLTYHSLALTGS